MGLKRYLSMLVRASQRLNIIFILHNKIKSLVLRKIIDIILVPLGILKYAFLVFTPRKKSGFRYNLSIVTIIKNEAPYIEEWIRYHKSIGVDHFYIYDNDSTDDINLVLKKFQNIVTYKKISGNLRQLDAYNNALNMYRNETRYLAVIDADEFIFLPRKHGNVGSVVNNYLSVPHIGGLVVNWVIFGSSNFERKPNGKVTDNYIYRSKLKFEKNYYVKTICNPRVVFSFTVSHAANYFPSYYAVNEKFQHVRWTRSDSVSVNEIRLNHYYSKSKEEFLKKRARGSGEVVGMRKLSEFKEHDKNDVFDDSMVKYNQANLNKKCL